MLKKIIALCIICSFLLPLVSAGAITLSESAAQKPTIEDIINEYQQKKSSSGLDAAQSTSTPTRSVSGSQEQTLEEEYIEKLNDAGYIAYYLTNDNYKELGDSLRSDFSYLFDSPDSSYIIAYENTRVNNTNGNSRNIPPDPSMGQDNDLYLNGSFYYTYQGEQYLMRVLTVTAADLKPYKQLSSKTYYEDDGQQKLWNIVSSVLSVGSDLVLPSSVGTILSFFEMIAPEESYEGISIITYTAASNWTTNNIEVYNFSDEEWRVCSMAEYVTAGSWVTFTYYDSEQNKCVQERAEQYSYFYSTHYDDLTYLCNYAALNYKDNPWFGLTIDHVEKVAYKKDGKTVFTHWTPNI